MRGDDALPARTWDFAPWQAARLVSGTAQEAARTWARHVSQAAILDVTWDLHKTFRDFGIALQRLSQFRQEPEPTDPDCMIRVAIFISPATRRGTPQPPCGTARWSRTFGAVLPAACLPAEIPGERILRSPRRWNSPTRPRWRSGSPARRPPGRHWPETGRSARSCGPSTTWMPRCRTLPLTRPGRTRPGSERFRLTSRRLTVTCVKR